MMYAFSYDDDSLLQYSYEVCKLVPYQLPASSLTIKVRVSSMIGYL